MMRRWSAVEKLPTLSKKSFGCANALGVRPVGAEQDPLDREVPGELVDALLDERRHPAVLDELVVGLLWNSPRFWPQDLERLQQRRHPRAAVLDVGDAHAGEALEELVRPRGCTAKSWTSRCFMSIATNGSNAPSSACCRRRRRDVARSRPTPGRAASYTSA